MSLVDNYCKVCGVYDEHYDEYSDVEHNFTPKHQSNLILWNYKENKHSFSKNRDGIIVLCNAESKALNNISDKITENNDKHKIRIYARPNEDVKFSFTITNNMNNEPFLIVGIQLAHPQPQFVMNDNPYVFGEDAHILSQKTTLKDEVSVTFKGQEVGQYEMPIIFTFFRDSIKKNLIIIREMVVVIQETRQGDPFIKSPYTGEVWGKVEQMYKTKVHGSDDNEFKIPKLLKILIPRGLEEKGLEGLKLPADILGQLRQLMVVVRNIFESGPSQNNYKMLYHHLLWWEEFITRSNLRKYNLAEVLLDKQGVLYILEVPGLAEKRPSLLRGDILLLRIHRDDNEMYQGRIKDISGNTVVISGVDYNMSKLWSATALWDVRFLLSRGPLQRMHEAVDSVISSKQFIRVDPEPLVYPVEVLPITAFYNPLIANNEEQKSAVEHIVACSSGLAPYIVFGPPGTGKTMTIVEAIMQIIVLNPLHRVLVCTESNMAADHITLKLLEFSHMLDIKNFILRANSRSREWSVMPAALHAVSNGTNPENWYDIANHVMAKHRIVVTTLQHSAKYKKSKKYSLSMTHLFIDEAAQACEPASLVPITGLLSPDGQLVLAGDPKQLGPVIFSRDAKQYGLGISLLQRLLYNYKHMYANNPDYITMLVKNFRSDPDILALPNNFFYNNQLQPLAQPDPLSKVSVLGLPGGDSAVVFHSVNSTEQRMGDAPSFFNVKEADMVKRYVNALLQEHKVKQSEIGIIAPYIRQVYKIKEWLNRSGYKEIEVGTVESFQGKEKRVIVVSTVRANCRLLDYDAKYCLGFLVDDKVYKIKEWLNRSGYKEIEVGTVESFQGKEKRVIVVSTVRANCRLLDYDAKYCLGFLVDDKRYNVTLTRAKAKLIIIGNAPCLSRDEKWRKFMELCKERNCYHGYECEQMERSSMLLVQVSQTNFAKCRLSEELKSRQRKENTDAEIVENLVYKIKEWLNRSGYKEIEVGTVESFQGKEKRVIVVSTVRANCRLLDYDAKYCLGFLVDDKRYNVTLTRAKAKLIIIGNAPCLSRDEKWRKFMELCKERNCYHGYECEQMERSSMLLVQVSQTNFAKCRLSEELKSRQRKENTDAEIVENLVYKIKEWLNRSGYKEIEVGTVESFQGKEKRVIVVSTVRANCRLLDYDAKYCLGFLVDDKRYNVTLTRAKAKLIIIGNAPCLSRDEKWRKFMELCKERNCYHGYECEQMERSSMLLVQVSQTNFAKCRLSEELKSRQRKENTDAEIVENLVKKLIQI